MNASLLDDFLIRALLAGAGVAIVASSLGCFVVWRKMAYFGDSLSHSALLGIALGLLTGINQNISIFIVCIIFAGILTWLEHKKMLSTDTLLGILAHASLSIGLVVISLLNYPSLDLHSLLFGDLLSVQLTDLYWIYGGGIFVIITLILNWSSLTLMTLNEELAQAEGVNVLANNLILMLLMTIVVSVSLQIVGVLLVTSMLIIPVASARPLSKSPEAMAIIASIFGLTSIGLGIQFSLHYDTPTGPSIVSIATLLFFLVTLASSLKKS